MKVLGFGAILWDDIGAAGTPANIGGSVFNVIAHLQKLGLEAYMLSAIGKDTLGKQTFKEIERLKVHREFISTVMLPTCVIPVSFSDRGSPSYTIPDNVSWDQICISDSNIQQMQLMNFNCIIYGTLEQRNSFSRNTLKKVLNKVSFRHRYVDLTLRGNFYDKTLLEDSMNSASIIKMNDEEALEVSRIFSFNEKRLEKLIPILWDKFEAEVIIITQGRNGALAGDGKSVIHSETYKVPIKDRVGNGDAFGAGFLRQFLKGESLERSCDYGNRLASVIISKQSSIPDYDLSEIERLDQKEEL